MPTLCITDRCTTLCDLAKDQARVTDPKQLENLTLSLGQLNHCGTTGDHFMPHQLLIVPNSDSTPTNPHELRMLKNAQREASYYSAEGRRMLYDTLGVFEPQDLNIFPAIADFAEENKSQLSDFNSFTGGGVAAVTSHAGNFKDALKKLDTLATQAARAPAAQRLTFRNQFNAAHADLNRRFAQELHMLVNNRGYINRYSPFLHQRSAYRQAQKLNAKSRTLPLMNQPEMAKLMRVMESAKWAGRGILVIDIASRSHTVANSDNKARETVREVVGLGFSTGLALATYSVGASVAIAIGPFGVIALIVASGAAAVLGDYGGKEIFDYLESGVSKRRPLARR